MLRRTLTITLAALVLSTGATAHAGAFDLDEDEPAAAPSASTVSSTPARTYSLRECLELADRNHPHLWAARARVAYAHAQLDEARTFPFWQWSATAGGGVAPQIGGTVIYNTSASPSALNPGAFSGYEPFFTFSISGAVPLYTFGKISAGKDAAVANIRVQEWDMEKVRTLVRMDVRRAFYGVMAARDAKYLTRDVISKIERAIEGMDKHLKNGDAGFDEIDKMRLYIYRDQVVARSGEADKNEAYAMAALRFFTGVQTGFDVPDKPLERPTSALGPELEYLSAARLHRPEINQARAGVVARKAQLDLQRARFFPDVGLQLSAGYNSYPSVTPQNNFWVANSWLNSFGFGIGVGARWNLDLLPNAARVAMVESQLEETRALLRFALGGVAVEIEQIYANALEARKREETWARLEHRSKEWIVSVQDAIDLGTKDERALLEPLRTFVDARINHVWALYDSNLTMSELARASGWDAAAPATD